MTAANHLAAVHGGTPKKGEPTTAATPTGWQRGGGGSGLAGGGWRRSASEPRRIRIGDRRYVNTGRGWCVLIETTTGGTVRLTRGEAELIESRYLDEQRSELGAA